MTTNAPPIGSPRLCSLVSKAHGEDPIGSAWAPERYLLIELPLPWTVYLVDARGFPPEVAPVAMRLREHGVDWGLIAVAPDPTYTRRGFTRVIDFWRPAPPLAGYDRDEYLVPDSELAKTLLGLLTAPDDRVRLEPFRQAGSRIRDLLVCTHGTVDACCAKFGYPAYKQLHAIAGDTDGAVRVWRASHFGGHRFAPTVLDLPEGRYWGHLEVDDLPALVHRNEPVEGLRHRYRGWSCLANPAEQVAERDAFMRVGWDWTKKLITSRVLDYDGSIDRSHVRLDFTTPDGSHAGQYEMIVEPRGSVRTMMHSGAEELAERPQLCVTRLSRQPSAVSRQENDGGRGASLPSPITHHLTADA